ncbi:helix-turn-helix domain-containing protein [Aneurinibacillus aneurinilyticus]|uniref:Putative HTH-type transcriptional regulator AnsR n=1 Tax=Aneurinibacillus aneurinilyticus ATCC 12856 TaxID=649747 RepID=U1YFH0_ANEAE|nr:helix-turn-helix transcriptional regulator [Aneurinibacillus aneurinilyticus]ERI10822.1 putative HTH-type transcriptional regulator AnsR [Aneurinibacillus aneurinilyticus ATCC 12856]MED0705911.1 helix-turn-helix transcriptional regulator [Aneurinibacillus aneurinilyticus]MED0722700.1 helix-turn-helix transcriptional regulator [Aneurinibacillus aneurinilyticus]MED0731380.1 helix-turn-helix transcriptional regulator [Aneurinibacillus aneurinilyticus]MED0740136.1 helix-turn-helix transcription
MLGKMLKEQRTKRKIRQEDVAKQIGIARTTYAMYEQGKREPDNETLQKLADFFKVSIDYLLGRTKDPNRIVSQETKELLNNIELSDEEIMEKFKFTIDGRELPEDKIKTFIEFVRAEWRARKGDNS